MRDLPAAGRYSNFGPFAGLQEIAGPNQTDSVDDASPAVKKTSGDRAVLGEGTTIVSYAVFVIGTEVLGNCPNATFHAGTSIIRGTRVGCANSGALA